MARMLMTAVVMLMLLASAGRNGTDSDDVCCYD